MSQTPRSPVGPPHSAPPRRIVVAALLTGLQGVVVAGLGLVMLVLLVAGEPDGVLQAATGAGTVLVLSALPLAAAGGLWRRQRWSRGPAVVVQVFALPTSWHLVQVGGVGAAAAGPLALVALIVLGCLMSPAAAEALGATPRRT